MAGKRRKDRPAGPPDPLADYDEDFEEDTLESIVGDLPAGPDDASEEPEETVSSIYAGKNGRRDDSDVLDTFRGDGLLERQKPRTFKDAHPALRRTVNISVTAALLALILVIIFGKVLSFGPIGLVTRVTSRTLSPVQAAFSSGVDAVKDYFRSLGRRANIGSAYSELLAREEELTYRLMQVEAYEKELARYEGLYAEASANQRLNPITCRVTGRDEGNYFSAFVIDKGSRSGIEPSMAVISNGALVGYVESVRETSATVRTIIDSEASIVALVSNAARDQGTIRGTLGIDGTAMCRLYHLPSGSKTQTNSVVVTAGVGMSFPKGIPIGVVRESTRAQAGEAYAIVEPLADFAHLETVVVLRYKSTPD